MAKPPQIPEGMNRNFVLPNITQIVSDSQFPAYLRMAAMDISSDSYSTVGSILANMCPQDLASVLGSWLHQLDQARESAEEDGALVMRISNPIVFSYMIFTVLVAKAEAGEIRFDPVTAGFQAELMASFMRAVILTNQYERVNLDLTKFTLNLDFLDQNFDYVISTENFKAIQYVNEVKQVWRSMSKSEILALVRGNKEPKKEELIRAPAANKFLSKKERGSKTLTSFKDLLSSSEVDVDLPLAKSQEPSLSDLAARLKRLSGG